jgi:hypothetical protein
VPTCRHGSPLARGGTDYDIGPGFRAAPPSSREVTVGVASTENSRPAEQADAVPGPGCVADIEAVYAVDDDVVRNRLITQTYWELSRAMRPLTGPHATWCTFSTWSSRTVGYFIRGDIDPLLEYRLSRLPRSVRRVARAPARILTRSLSGLRKRAAPRLLGRGNSEIFREIAAEFARFIHEFSDARPRDDARWTQYQSTITPTRATDAFPAAEVKLLCDGFKAYYEAIDERDPHRQAELVLRANMLLADYEQRRVDPIVRSALSLFPSRLLNDDPDDPELVTVRDKKPWALQEKGRIRSWIDATYARFVTKWRMAIVLPASTVRGTGSELIRVGWGLPKPAPGEPLYPARLHTLRDPAVVDVWNRYDRGHGSYRAARAANWTSLGDRMNCIVNVFRARQDRSVLFDVEPLTPDELRVARARGLGH